MLWAKNCRRTTSPRGGILGSKSDDFAVNQEDLKLVTAHNVKHLEASRDEDEWFA
jgi:hypothetical protein